MFGCTHVSRCSITRLINHLSPPPLPLSVGVCWRFRGGVFLEFARLSSYAYNSTVSWDFANSFSPPPLVSMGGIQVLLLLLLLLPPLAPLILLMANDAPIIWLDGRRFCFHPSFREEEEEEDKKKPTDRGWHFPAGFFFALFQRNTETNETSKQQHSFFFLRGPGMRETHTTELKNHILDRKISWVLQYKIN